MVTVYLCFLVGGAIIPIVSFLLGFLGDGMDTDTDMDMDMDVDVDVDLNTELDIGTDTEGMFSTDSDLDVGTDIVTGSALTIGFFPTSIMALSAMSIVFGAVGAIMTLSGKGKLLSLLVAIISGYIASVIIQTIIKTLKKVQTRNYGVNENELLLYDGKVVDTILPGQLGTVSFTTLQNTLISYPARCVDKDLRLEAGRIVKAIELKDGVFIVEPKNRYE